MNEHHFIFVGFLIGCALMIYGIIFAPDQWYKLWFADALIANLYFAWKHRPRR